MLKHIQFFAQIFADIKQAETIIAGIKSQFCIFGLKVVDYIYDANRKHPNAAKVIKILDWLDFVDLTKV